MEMCLMQAAALAILHVLRCKDEAALSELVRGLTLSNPAEEGSLTDSDAKPIWVAPESVVGKLREFLEADSAEPRDASSSSAALSTPGGGSTSLGISRREVWSSCPTGLGRTL